ncbi:MAG: hypothetical protein FD544_000364 [Pelagibacterales bacterium]|mgnify:CR=1 FL=1|nr:hypothetical protein [Pelagibacterales bacterium]|tara:strand:+ start:885 stop:1151 length:267 start_codon:yes stop_codon:yes gene_type:complete
MLKNILSVLIFLFTISFLYFIGSVYFSDKEELKIKKNRKIIIQRIKDSAKHLPILINDTNNIIKFNSSFDNTNNRIERNFWKLFKKND